MDPRVKLEDDDIRGQAKLELWDVTGFSPWQLTLDQVRIYRDVFEM